MPIRSPRAVASLRGTASRPSRARFAPSTRTGTDSSRRSNSKKLLATQGDAFDDAEVEEAKSRWSAVEPGSNGRI